MATTLFKEVSYSLAKLIHDIDMGEIGLPDIQRPFVWHNNKVRDLFDSMYKGFPVGYLLFWASATDSRQKHIGTDKKQKYPRLLIVDGQQRLTSLFAVLKGIEVVREDFRKEKIAISFRPSDCAFEVANAASRRDPEFIPDISLLWSGSVPRNRFQKDFFQRLRERRDVTEQDEDRLAASIDQLFNLQDYPFTAMELSATVDEEQVADIFVRINSKGQPLNQADFILTLMSVFWDDGRADLEKFCRSARQPTNGTASSFNHFIHPDPDQLLRVSVAVGHRRARLQHVYSLLRGKDLDTGLFSEEQREKQFAILKTAQDKVLNLQDWHEFLKVLVRAGYRQGDHISSQVNLLFCYAYFLIGKHELKIDAFRLRNLIARWFFMTSLTSRYTGSPESVMEQDLAALREIKTANEFEALIENTISNGLTDDFWAITLPNELATSSARSPSLFAFYASLNLLDARVLFSKMKVAELLDPACHANKSATERHHLFPKAHLAKKGIVEPRDTNQIANYALVEWSDNIAISDDGPEVYFPLYAERFKADALTEMCYWHALPESWECMTYEEFLIARRKLIANVIRDGFKKLSE